MCCKGTYYYISFLWLCDFTYLLSLLDQYLNFFLSSHSFVHFHFLWVFLVLILFKIVSVFTFLGWMTLTIIFLLLICIILFLIVHFLFFCLYMVFLCLCFSSLFISFSNTAWIRQRKFDRKILFFSLKFPWFHKYEVFVSIFLSNIC